MSKKSNTIFSPRWQFVRTQTVKGALGLLLCTLYALVFGGPDAAEALVFLAVTAPLGLAGFGLTSISLRTLEAASMAVNGALLSLLILFTGGLSSPFLVWLVLLPFEGALSGGANLSCSPGLSRSPALAASH